MVVLALDIGQTRIGIAVSDRDARIAMPLKVLPAGDVISLARPFRLILEDHEPELLVCGLPQTMAGEEGPQAQRVRRIAELISKRTSLPIEFVDERLSSAESKRALREAGLTEKQMRGKVDMIAASLFLQVWLDSHKEGDERA
ncbi:MAG: Holliday junction resolvase RuvX [Collinsella sp.]|nr:Holliday junction resolvase RuvX [Collinsella sp.]